MLKKVNDRGFTLIEIIVTLLISTIIMGIVTTLILNSMGYFNKTAVSDHDKQSLDGISEYVCNQLRFASEVRIDINRPKNAEGGEDTDWKWLYVGTDNMLYKDNGGEVGKDILVFNADFYNNRLLTIVAKGYDNYRLDLTFEFMDKNAEKVYSTKSTLELLNLKVSKEKNKSFIPITQKEVSMPKDTGYKIYYKSGNINIDNNSSTDGTVSDELICNKDGFSADAWIAGKEYKKGDFVSYDNVIYRAITSGKSQSAPNVVGGNTLWKRIYSATWSASSVYEKNDIVNYNGRKYICISENGITETSSNSAPAVDTKRWQIATQEQINEAIIRHQSSTYCDNSLSQKGTVADEINCLKGNDKGTWNASTAYKYGDFVYYEKQWYLMSWPGTTTGHPPTATNLWKRVDGNFDLKSYYEWGDIVISDNKYWQVITLSTTNHAPPLSLIWGGPYNSVDETIKATGIIPSYYYCSDESIYKGLVMNKDDGIPASDIEDWPGTSHGQLVFRRYGADKAIWYKIRSGAGNSEPGVKAQNGQYKGEFIWQKIQLDWDATSGYLANDEEFGGKADIVRYGQNGRFYKAIKDNVKGEVPAVYNQSSGKWIASSGWQEVFYVYGEWVNVNY